MASACELELQAQVDGICGSGRTTRVWPLAKLDANSNAVFVYLDVAEGNANVNGVPLPVSDRNDDVEQLIAM